MTVYSICKICQYLLKSLLSGLTKWRSLGGKKNRPKHFYKMGPNTPTFRNHGLGQIFHTHEKKVDSVGLVEASLELGVSSEGFVKTREGGGVSLHTLEDGGEE